MPVAPQHRNLLTAEQIKTQCREQIINCAFVGLGDFALKITELAVQARKGDHNARAICTCTHNKAVFERRHTNPVSWITESVFQAQKYGHNA